MESASGKIHYEVLRYVKADDFDWETNELDPRDRSEISNAWSIIGWKRIIITKLSEEK